MSDYKISIISPVYGAETLLEELVNRIINTVTKLTDNYEIILVEDHSPDKSWKIITELASKNTHVVGISLSRNFGQQHSINAGMDYATGDYIITMDCDLQDEPENIPSLIDKALEGYDIVFASRRNRKDSFLKKIGSKWFYKLMGYLTDTKQDSSIANFVLYSKKALNALSDLGDYYRYYPLLNQWIGFNTIKLPIEHAKRSDNKKSSYSIKKRVKLAFSTIIAFSDKPLRIMLKAGIFIVLSVFVFAIFLVFKYLFVGTIVSGWLSVFLSLWLLSGLIIVMLGLVGIYVGKSFESVKKRPVYIVKEIVNNNSK